MTIKEVCALINSGEIETTDCGLASNMAYGFKYGGESYMLSEIKGHYISLWRLTRSPNEVIDRISLKKEGN